MRLNCSGRPLRSIAHSPSSIVILCMVYYLQTVSDLTALGEQHFLGNCITILCTDSSCFQLGFPLIESWKGKTEMTVGGRVMLVDQVQKRMGRFSLSSILCFKMRHLVSIATPSVWTQKERSYMQCLWKHIHKVIIVSRGLPNLQY